MHNSLEDHTVRTVLETPDGVVFVGCESGLYKSADGGNSWKQVYAEDGINSLAVSGGVLICGAAASFDAWSEQLSAEGVCTVISVDPCA